MTDKKISVSLVIQSTLLWPVKHQVVSTVKFNRVHSCREQAERGFLPPVATKLNTEENMWPDPANMGNCITI